MQRAIADLSGLRSTDPDTRPWLRHAAWPESYLPLVDPPQLVSHGEPRLDTYEFVRVEGDGVHEIAVGPVHAGTIEPGHFRFSVVGEKVLRLEERLGTYTRVSSSASRNCRSLAGASACRAGIGGFGRRVLAGRTVRRSKVWRAREIPPRAAWLRALYLELERIANHLGDLGALGNDAGFAFGLAQFSRLKEQLLRANHEALGERYLMDAVVPGGTRCDLASNRPARCSATVCGRSQHEVRTYAQSTTSTRGCVIGLTAPARVSAGARRASRTHRPRRPRERPGVRSAHRPAVRAVCASLRRSRCGRRRGRCRGARRRPLR